MGKIIIIILILIVVCVFVIKYIKFNKQGKNEIPNDYIMKFVGNSNITYIYNIENGHKTYGFNYINVSGNKITDRGELVWTIDIFKVAKSNNAYNYIILKNGDKMEIDEFRDKFLVEKDDLYE